MLFPTHLLADRLLTPGAACVKAWDRWYRGYRRAKKACPVCFERWNRHFSRTKLPPREASPAQVALYIGRICRHIPTTRRKALRKEVARSLEAEQRERAVAVETILLEGLTG